MQFFRGPLAVAALALALTLLAACGGSIEQDILGKWEEVDGPEAIEFAADGAVTLRFQGMVLEGRYEFLDRQRVLLDLRGPQVSSDPIEAPVVIDSGVLAFTMPDGRVASYKRAD